MPRATNASPPLPVVNIVVRGELFRKGGQFSRVSADGVEGGVATSTRHDPVVDCQNAALATLVDRFLVPCRAHFSIHRIVFDVTLAQMHLPHLMRVVRRLYKKGYARKQVQVFTRFRSTGSQLENIALACHRVPAVHHTFVLRGDTHLLRTFPFKRMTDPNACYVLNRMPALPSDAPKQYRVVDTFWYVPKQWLAAFENALHANMSRKRLALHNFYWRRLPDAGVPNEALRILQPDVECEPTVTPLMFIVNRPVRADHLALVDERTRQRLAKLHVEVFDTRRLQSHKRTHRPRASRRRARGGRRG